EDRWLRGRADGQGDLEGRHGRRHHRTRGGGGLPPLLLDHPPADLPDRPDRRRQSGHRHQQRHDRCHRLALQPIRHAAGNGGGAGGPNRAGAGERDRRHPLGRRPARPVGRQERRLGPDEGAQRRLRCRGGAPLVDQDLDLDRPDNSAWVRRRHRLGGSPGRRVGRPGHFRALRAGSRLGDGLGRPPLRAGPPGPGGRPGVPLLGWTEREGTDEVADPRRGDLRRALGGGNRRARLLLPVRGRLRQRLRRAGRRPRLPVLALRDVGHPPLRGLDQLGPAQAERRGRRAALAEEDGARRERRCRPRPRQGPAGRSGGGRNRRQPGGTGRRSGGEVAGRGEGRRHRRHPDRRRLSRWPPPERSV
ncbi:MAG: hypothetical protein AVDCRST_MAG59-1386, partial [uncultured Thermomicrobiales bacterium]